MKQKFGIKCLEEVVEMTEESDVTSLSSMNTSFDQDELKRSVNESNNSETSSDNCEIMARIQMSE